MYRIKTSIKKHFQTLRDKAVFILVINDKATYNIILYTVLMDAVVVFESKLSMKIYSNLKATILFFSMDIPYYHRIR